MSYHEDPIESAFTRVGEAVERPPRWTVKNLIPKGLTFLSGPPKSYKSSTLAAACLSTLGLANNVLPPDLLEVEEDERGPVMGLSLEADAGTLRFNSRQGIGVHIPEDADYWVQDDPMAFRLDNKADIADLLGWRERAGARVLFIDPLRNAHNHDENDSSDMVHMLQPFQRDAVRHDYSVVVVQHSTKLGDGNGGQRTARASDMRGTSAMFGLADAVLSHTKKGTGEVHIDAVFKRGEPWERTIKLGIWGNTAMESIDSTTAAVFTKVLQGCALADLPKEMHLSKARVREAVAALTRLGALTATGTATSGAEALVASAVRKFAG